ncbi:hypothetical protein WJX79_010750 [Trebouxia sp. C0005]
MSLLHADLPSEDEADDDYDPSRDDKADKAGRQKIAKRRRGSAAYPDTPKVEDDEPEPGIDRDNASSLAKKAKIDQLWAQLNEGKATSQPAKAPVKKAPQSSEVALLQQASGSQPLSLAAICRPVTKKQKADSDTHWKRQLGITSVNAQGKGADEDSNQRAAAAAAAAAAAQGKTESKTITETRRFAGKDIQYKRAATEHDAKATKAQDIKKGGLDALLGSLQQAKKVNVLDKSRMDWGDFKSSDVKVDEELEGYKKSGDKYLDKVDFLKRAELRQYEKERDQRLSQDMRSRGRL